MAAEPPNAPRGPADVRVVDPARLDDCRALWLGLRDHHHGTDPGLGPVRGDDDSWARAREAYGAAILRGEGFLVLAEEPGRPADAPLGCALVNLVGGSPTWTITNPYGELEVISVDPAARGLGVGSALLDAVQAELDRLGASELRLIVTAGNVGAQAFYREAGFETFALELRRPAGDA